ncbi:hypothetical protein IF2G_03603 [Cordyceps javanica]|nr:hypothetical protein IF2G_03603 [Cordyceps javanica]
MIRYFCLSTSPRRAARRAHVPVRPCHLEDELHADAPFAIGAKATMCIFYIKYHRSYAFVPGPSYPISYLLRNPFRMRVARSCELWLRRAIKHQHNCKVSLQQRNKSPSWQP